LEAVNENFFTDNGCKFGSFRRSAVFSLAAKTVVDDTYGGCSPSFRTFVGFRFGLWSRPVHLHIVLNVLLADIPNIPNRLDVCSRLIPDAG